jgi:hypothetical protein
MPTEGNINRAIKLTQQRVRDYQREKDKNEDYPKPREMKTIATLSHFFKISAILWCCATRDW